MSNFDYYNNLLNFEKSFKIIVYNNKNDFENHNGEILVEYISTYNEALRIANEYLQMNNKTLRVQSYDNKEVTILHN